MYSLIFASLIASQTKVCAACKDEHPLTFNHLSTPKNLAPRKQVFAHERRGNADEDLAFASYGVTSRVEDQEIISQEHDALKKVSIAPSNSLLLEVPPPEDSHEDDGHVHCHCHDHSDDHYHGSTVDPEDLYTHLLIAGIIFGLTAICALIPMKFMKKHHENSKAQYLNVFSSGSILGLCLVHIVPEAVEKIMPICGSRVAKVMTLFAFAILLWRFMEDISTSWGVTLPHFIPKSADPHINDETNHSHSQSHSHLDPHCDALSHALSHAHHEEDRCCAFTHEHPTSDSCSSVVSVGHKHEKEGGSLYLSILATSIHCFVEGAFIVVSHQKWLTCFSILMHKLIVAFSFGSKVALTDNGQGRRSRAAIGSLALFVLSTPLAIVLVACSASNWIDKPELAIVDWIAAGLVMTLATSSLYDANVALGCRRRICIHYLIMASSLAVICGIVLAMPHDHSH